MRIPIVFSTDHNFVMQTGVCIYSLLNSAVDSRYEIYVLINEDVSEEDKEALRKQTKKFDDNSIEFIEIGDVFKGAFEIRGISIAAYSRLLIPWLLPQHDYVIYSDVDIIYKTDLEDVYQNGKVPDKLISGVAAIGFRINEKEQEYTKKLGLEPQKYINSGFIVFNCKQLRIEGLKNRLLDEARKMYIYQDQDILNIVCKNRIHYLSPQYNLTPNFFNLYKSHNEMYDEYYGDEGIQRKCLACQGCIIHYPGAKPWETFTYAWREWWAAYAASDFYDPEFEYSVSQSIKCQLKPRSVIKKMLIDKFHSIRNIFK